MDYLKLPQVLLLKIHSFLYPSNQQLDTWYRHHKTTWKPKKWFQWVKLYKNMGPFMHMKTNISLVDYVVVRDWFRTCRGLICHHITS